MRFFQTTGVEEQWRAVVAPWLREKAATAWRDPRPTVILTPSRAESFYLRSRLVEEELSFFGLRFWTPSDLRVFLLGEVSLEMKPATEAELRLVARASAEKLAQKSDEPTLASVEREPGLFLRAYDLLLGAGWSPAKEGASYGRGLAREMERRLKDNKIATQAGLHRLLRQQSAKKKEPLLADLLMAGFNANHWPLWDLLRAAVASAEKATLSFPAPRGFGGEIDQLWIGSWEEELTLPVEFPEDDKGEIDQPFSGWVGAYERGDTIEARDRDFTFIASGQVETQVRAIVLQALTYLGSDSCRRLGIVFPEANALSLGVAEELRRLEIPIDDGTGFLQPGIFERRAWPAWLNWQEEPSVQRLIEWIRAADAEKIDLGLSLSARELADRLNDAFAETLIDDLSFLGRYLEQSSGRTREVRRFLRSLIRLPESGMFGEFWDAARRARKNFGRDGLVEPPSWLRDAGWIISRRTFLAWLRESTDSRERMRGAEGNHFYGKVHLLIYAQMPGQTWSHLILTGLSEGRWPRIFETGAFGSRYELTELNRQARSLNRRVVKQGAQGEGHEVVRPDRGHCLLPLERHDLALRDLCAAVESTSEAVCFSALSAEGGRTLLPSDFFAQAYQAKTGRTLDEISLVVLSKSTTDWCQRHADLLRPPEKKKTRADTTRIAYAARRDARQPFGPYQFAFAAPPQVPIQLACKTWETAWFHPDAVWLKKIVGVSAWPEGQLGWPRAVGTWVHRWLKSALQTCRETKDPGRLLGLLRLAADEERARLTKQAGAALYPWWNQVWNQARAVALGLGEALVPELKERFFLSEYSLPGRAIALPGTDHADFDLRGKIDLLLIDAGTNFDPTSGDFSGCTCWVIDFKTGSAKNLTAGQLEKGIGLQAMLYALAVRNMGAMAAALSLQTFDAPLEPQAQIEQVEANVALFRGLDRLHRQGIFGQRPAPENEYGFAPAYPLATRPIEGGVLEAKWALTHGAAVLGEGP